MGQNHSVVTILMKSVCVVLYIRTVCLLVLSSCWPGMLTYLC